MGSRYQDDWEDQEEEEYAVRKEYPKKEKKDYKEMERYPKEPCKEKKRKPDCDFDEECCLMIPIKVAVKIRTCPCEEHKW